MFVYQPTGVCVNNHDGVGIDINAFVRYDQVLLCPVFSISHHHIHVSDLKFGESFHQEHFVNIFIYVFRYVKILFSGLFKRLWNFKKVETNFTFQDVCEHVEVLLIIQKDFNVLRFKYHVEVCLIFLLQINEKSV